MGNDLREFGSAALQTQARRNERKIRVLAVDDEPSILELLKTALNALGIYDVMVAASAEQAVQVMERQDHPFDCVLMDIQMPEVNGITLVREMRKMRDYARTPIIMLTAMSDRTYVDQAFAAGATDYVTKPFELLELRSRLGTATMLVLEQDRARDGIAVAKKLKDELDSNLQFNFDDPVVIGDIDNVLGYAEFENYIIQLSQGRLFNSVATGVKIVDAAEHYARMSSSEFRQVIHDVATAIARQMRKTGNLITYRGKGAFVTVSHKRAEALDPGAEKHLNQILGTLRSRFRDTHGIVLTIGEPVSMRSLTKYGALQSLTRALEATAGKPVPARQIAAMSQRAFSSRGRSSAEAHLERRAYETILNDLLREEPTLRSS